MSFCEEIRRAAQPMWEAGYRHPFLQQLGSGALEREIFQFYLLQDYVYLLEYAKVYALALTKATQERHMARLACVPYNILNREMQLHREYMRRFGIAPEQAERVQPSLVNGAYTAGMLAVAQSGDLAEALAAVLPCNWVYSDYARRLARDFAGELADNPYRSWIETYAGDAFAESFEWHFSALDDLCAQKSPEARARVERIFLNSVRFECLFWDMAYRRDLALGAGISANP